MVAVMPTARLPRGEPDEHQQRKCRALLLAGKSILEANFSSGVGLTYARAERSRLVKERKLKPVQRATGLIHGARSTDRLNGESFRHAAGYVPVYPGLTDMKAFRGGLQAYARRRPMSKNPYKRGTKKWNSWKDAWLWAASRDSYFIPPADASRWRGNGEKFGAV